MSDLKTNAMRILEANQIPYTVHTYEPGDSIDGVSTAGKIGKPANEVYKTLVTKGKDNYFVFVLPVTEELDLKKAAKAAGADAGFGRGTHGNHVATFLVKERERRESK